MEFKQLDLIAPILKALTTEGYITPTPIQAQSIPLILEQRDLLGCAQTGTGKTAAFAIPILQLLYKNKTEERGPHKIKVLYFGNGDVNELKVFWTLPGGKNQVIPGTPCLKLIFDLNKAPAEESCGFHEPSFCCAFNSDVNIGFNNCFAVSSPIYLAH